MLKFDLSMFQQLLIQLETNPGAQNSTPGHIQCMIQILQIK